MGIFRKSYHELSDERLMKLITACNEQAFNELYARYARKMHYYLYRMMNHDREQAHDLLQELFMKIVQRPEMFDTSRNFSSWIYTVAGNMCKNEYRKAEKERMIDNREDIGLYALPTEDEAGFDGKAFEEALKNELSDLGENHRMTFVLRYQEEKSVREIAEIMDCSEGTVKSRIFYTTKRLSQRLKTFDPNHTNDTYHERSTG